MTKKLPNVCEEPEPVRRAWTKLRDQHGINLLHADRQIVFDTIAHELAEVIRNRDYDPGAVEPVHLTIQADADLIEPEAQR